MADREIGIFHNVNEHNIGDDDGLEFRQFCETGEILRQNSGNASVVTAICLESSDFDHNELVQLLCIVIILGVGAFVRDILRRLSLNIPYTATMFFVGLGVGQAASQSCPLMEKFVAIVHVKPQIILSTFLPILIFESGFSINIHTFRRTLPQILLLAGPGLLFSTFLTAALSLFLFVEYEWNFVQACLFGSIVSATDPVAVVGLLRELGASESLSVLIEGESLLNDGIAVLLFKIFEDLLQHKDVHEDWGVVVWDGFIKFLLIAIGGPLFGYIFAKLAIFCLSKVHNDSCVEVSITLASAYLTFFIGEDVLGISGILSMVLLALTLKANSTCISPKSEEPLKYFWEVMGYMANTLLFFIIGLIIGRKAFERLDAMDFPYLLTLYAAVMLIRLAMLILLKPILAKLGYGFGWKNLLVVGWGGLRGAVGICLALEVYEGPHLCGMDKLGPQILFQTAGIVLLTLLLNATTTKMIMEALDMTSVSQRQRLDMENAYTVLEHTRRKYLFGLKNHTDFLNSDWKSVSKFTFIVSDYYPVPRHGLDLEENDFRSSVKAKTKLMFEAMSKRFTKDPVGESPEIRSTTKEMQFEFDEENRIRVLKAFKISFRRQYEQGVIQGSVLKFVLDACNRIEDTSQILTSNDLMSRWNLEERNLEERNFKSIPCGNIARFSRLFSYFLEESEKERVHLSLEVGKSFVSAVDQVVKLLPKMFHDAKDRDVQFIKTILEREKYETILKLGSLQMNYSKMVVAAKSRYASRTVINHMKATLIDLRTDGLIERSEAKVVMQLLEQLIKKLHKCPKTIGPTSAEAFLDNLSWFRKMLQPQTFKFLKSRAVLLNFLPGDVIYKVGDLPNGIYLIITGLAKIRFVASERLKMARRRYGMFPVCEILTDMDFKDSISDLIGPGGVVGELGYLKQECRASSVSCQTFVTSYFFPVEALDQVSQVCLMSYPPDNLPLHLWTSWGFKVASSLCQYLPKFQEWSIERIQGYLEGGVVPSIKPLSVFEIPDFVSDVVVIEGYFEDVDSKELFIAPSLIPRECNSLFSKRNPLTVNRLLVVIHDGVPPDLLHQYLNASGSSFITNTLGSLNGNMIAMKQNKVSTGKRMDIRQRRVSLAITSSSASGKHVKNV